MKKPSLKQIKQKRDGGGGAVMVIPLCVMNSISYKSLSGNGIKLLYDMAMQYNLTNNGAILASFRYMSTKRGWKSSDTLHKAKKELEAHGLICKTVQGRLPNKASYYGLTWLALDEIDGLEISAQAWPRGEYDRWKPPEIKPNKRKPPLRKNTTACP